MRNFRVIAALGAAMVMSAPAPALATDSPVAGTWATEAKTDFGTFAATLTVAETADGYSIAMVDAPMPPPPGAPGGPESAPPPMESTISDVKVEGSNFSFKRKLETPQGPIELSYSGSVAGDTMTGKADSAFGAIPFTGKRQ